MEKRVRFDVENLHAYPASIFMLVYAVKRYDDCSDGFARWSLQWKQSFNHTVYIEHV